MIPTRILKAKARNAMRGNFGKALYASIFPQIFIFAVTFIILAIIPGFADSVRIVMSGSFANDEEMARQTFSLMEDMSNAVNLISILLSFLTFGSKFMHLGLIRAQKVKYGDLFRFFSCWIQAAMCVLIFWAAELVIGLLGGVLLLLILEFVINLKFAFVEYIIVDAGGHGVIAAFKKAWRMTDGKTMINIFVLELSFIGWSLLVLVTLGIAALYVQPYSELATAALYDEKKSEYDAISLKTENL